MEKTEIMKRYEAETGKQSTRFVTDGIHSVGIEGWHYEYIVWLEAKATAYDRLMSMNSISENDIQIVLDGNAWCAYRIPFRNLQEDDAGFGATPQMALTALLESEGTQEVAVGVLDIIDELEEQQCHLCGDESFDAGWKAGLEKAIDTIKEMSMRLKFC